ncbi:hypothetical protein E4K67_22445 [Desulfosporosinus fructosivorans]|uniref:Uncharacterized protein n=1 Tax=Desulfosporosinus fructosivorans TaxID=2018669 RepID=A0A4Z0R021_9FIRM|nr:hypothetical protein [Desulfosporosinus fructosivorans]TGE35879.1 hypothetical protein E4K67_22445 [Desulfosporosinus fructosivorans]
MINGNAGVSSAGDGLNGILDSLRSLSKIDVLVGIPEEESSREGGKVTNAELAFIHTKGSPLNKIPPRPFVEPAIEDPENREMIAVELRKAAESALDEDSEAVSRFLARAGLQGQNVVRDWFTNSKNGWPPNTPGTVLAKLRKDNSSIAQAAVRYVDEGGSLSDITGLEGMTRPMIDTDQLRKAVTYVIREK